MQSGKKATATMKEKAANVAASAQSGMEKTKATLQEKAEKVTARDPLKKEMATDKKEARIAEAELHKREAMEHNAAHKAGYAPGSTGYPTGPHVTPAVKGDKTGVPTGRAEYAPGSTGYPTGPHVTPVVPGDKIGVPTGPVEEGIVESHPIGRNTRTGQLNPGLNPDVSGYNTGHGTGGYTG
ncbi:hypothetical protein Dimus_029655 [Dionaea muscipula]